MCWRALKQKSNKKKAGWSALLLFAYGIRHIFAWPSPFSLNIFNFTKQRHTILRIGMKADTIVFSPWENETTVQCHFSHLMTKPTKWSVHPAKTQISLGIHQWVAKVSMLFHADSEDCGCPGWSESSLGTQIILLVLSCYGSFGEWCEGHYWWECIITIQGYYLV